MESLLELQEALQDVRDNAELEPKQQAWKEARLTDKIIVAQSIAILQEDHPITVRRLHYLLAQTIPAFYKNTLAMYNKLTALITTARKKGDVQYEWIDDPTRAVHSVLAWESVEDYAQTARTLYDRNKWQTQPCDVEVWVEKDSLLSVLRATCRKWQITLRSLHGQGSNTAAYEVAKLISERADTSKPFYVLYFGDMDPCGEMIPESMKERVESILQDKFNNYTTVHLIRLGFNYEDFDALDVESIDNKPKDSNLAKYLERHGEDAKFAEVEALPKALMVERVENTLQYELMDFKAWVKEEKQEAKDKRRITKALLGLK